MSDSAKVKIFFDNYSKGFSSIYNEDDKPRSTFDKFIDKFFRRAVFLRFKKTLEFTSNENIKSILDLGCGPGHYVIEFLKQKKDVTALDIAPLMIELTEKRVANLNFDSEFKTITGDYMDIKFDKKYDAICAMGFFDYIKDPVTVIKKLISDCNKEIYISIPDPYGILGLQRRVRYWLKNCPLYLYSYERIIDVLKDAGCLENTDIIRMERGFFIRIKIEH